MSMWKCEYCHHLVDSLYHQCVNKQLIEWDKEDDDEDEEDTYDCCGGYDDPCLCHDCPNK